MTRLRSRFRPWVLAVLVVGGLVGWKLGLSDNFATVRPGTLYRSGQMEASALSAVIDRHRIKTVLNLRGSHPESSWYRAERAATLGAGATQVDIPLSSCEWMSRAQARALLEVLDSAERPLLIHCFHGSERTGLVAAFAELLRPGATVLDAERQFSAWYLYSLTRPGSKSITLTTLPTSSAGGCGPATSRASRVASSGSTTPTRWSSPHAPGAGKSSAADPQSAPILSFF